MLGRLSNLRGSGLRRSSAGNGDAQGQGHQRGGAAAEAMDKDAAWDAAAGTGTAAMGDAYERHWERQMVGGPRTWRHSFPFTSDERERRVGARFVVSAHTATASMGGAAHRNTNTFGSHMSTSSPSLSSAQLQASHSHNANRASARMGLGGTPLSPSASRRAVGDALAQQLSPPPPSSPSQQQPSNQLQLTTVSHPADLLKWKGLAADSVSGRMTVWGDGDGDGDGGGGGEAATGVLDADDVAYVRSLFFAQTSQPPRATMRAGGKSNAAAASATTSGGGGNGNAPNGLGNPDQKSVLDPKRATTLTVAMKKLNVKPAKLAWALREMNERYLTPAACDLMLACELWPSSKEEFETLRLAAEHGEDLAPPDALVYYLGVVVPDTEARVRALVFRHEFEASLADTQRGVKLMLTACEEVRASQRLRSLMRLVLASGNAANEGAGGAAVRGVVVASLAKLGQTKSPEDRSLTLLDCVVQLCAKNCPDALEVSEELPSVQAVRRHSFAAFGVVLRDARRGVDRARRIPQLSRFVSDATSKLDKLEADARAARTALDATLAYFGYPTGVDANEFFVPLHGFLENFGQSVKKQLEQQQRQRAQTGASGFMTLGAAPPASSRRRSFFPTVFQQQQQQQQQQRPPRQASPEGAEDGDTVGALPTLPSRNTTGGGSRRTSSMFKRTSVFGRFAPSS